MWSPMLITLVDAMGCDNTVVSSARVSFNSNPGGYEGGTIKAERLINYLAKHNHWTPFAHCFSSFAVTVPIFVARQWFKHTVGFAYNEVSRRYVNDTPDMWYTTSWRSKPEGNIKQGSSSKIIPMEEETSQLMLNARDHYEKLIEQGVAPEMARMVLPQATMTKFRVTGSLAAWARFYNLRADDHAQHEIRWCAQEIGDNMMELFPISWAALCNNCELKESTDGETYDNTTDKKEG